jgi:hypothetical protein
MSLPRTTITMDCKRCSSMLLKANPVLTIIRVRRTDRTRNNRRRKGRPISPTSSATVVTRKATIKANITPGSSVMTCKDPVSSKPRTSLFEQRKALAKKLLRKLNP